MPAESKPIPTPELMIPLAETLQTLRHELELAQSLSTKEDIMFDIENVELELKVVVAQTLKGETGIKFYVINAGAGVESSSEATHTIRFNLTPVNTKSGDQNGNRVRVSSQRKVKTSNR